MSKYTINQESWVVPAGVTSALAVLVAKICCIIDSCISCWAGQTVQESNILLRSEGVWDIDSYWVRVMSWALHLGTSVLLKSFSLLSKSSSLSSSSSSSVGHFSPFPCRRSRRPYRCHPHPPHPPHSHHPHPHSPQPPHPPHH